MDRHNHFSRTFSWEELEITSHDIARSFGSKEGEIADLINVSSLLKSLRSLDDMQAGYLILRDAEMDQDTGILKTPDILFHIGPKLAPRFRNIEMLAVVICSAGAKIDELARSSLIEGNLLESYYVEALGPVIVEKLYERICEHLATYLNPSGLSLTSIYHPGYCGWDLKEQSKIFSLLPDNFCNVSLTESCLMVPIKSTSGFIGIGKNVFDSGHECEICDRVDCYLRKS